MCLEDDKNKAPFLPAKKNGLNPPTVGILVGKAHRPASINPASDRVQIGFNRLGSDRFAVGKSDLRQRANLRDDVESHVSRHAAVKV